MSAARRKNSVGIGSRACRQPTIVAGVTIRRRAGNDGNPGAVTGFGRSYVV
jgi:hypothetical protein